MTLEVEGSAAVRGVRVLPDPLEEVVPARIAR